MSASPRQSRQQTAEPRVIPNRRAAKTYDRMTKTALIQRLEELERRQPAAGIAFEHERLQHDLQAHQVELAAQNQELRVAQRLLEESRDRYADLYDFSPAGHLALDAHGILREINLTACAMLGAERSRLEGLPFLTHVDPDDRAQLREHLRPREHPGARVESELRLVAKGRPTIVVVMQSLLVGDEADGAVLCRATLTDITRSQAAEQALRTASELLESTGIMAQVGGWEVDLRTMQQAWTQQTFHILDLDPPVPPSVEQGISMYAPASQPLIQAAVDNAIANGTPYDLELQAITRKGRLIWVRAQGSAVRRNGQASKLVGTFQDITARKRAEEAQQETAARFRRLVETTRMIAWERPAGARSFTYVSERAVEALGYPLADWAKDDFFDQHLVHPDDQARVAAQRAEALQQNDRDFELEYRLISAEGRALWFRDLIHVVAGPQGPEMLKGFLSDITRRKHAESGLRELTERFELAVAGTADGLWDWDIATGAVFYAPRFKVLLGHAPDDPAFAPTIAAFKERLHPDDLASTEDAIRRAIEDGVPYRATYRLKTKDDQWRWFEARGTTVREGTAPATRMAGSITDITQRRQAEEALRESDLRQRLALEGADLGLWDWDVAGGGFIVNERWCSMLGYRLEDIAPHIESWRALVHPDDWPAVNAAWEAHRDAQTPRYEVEHRLGHRDGSWVWVLDKGRAVERDPAGQPLRVCGTHLDITARHAAKAALRASEELFRQMTEAIAQVFWMTSTDKGTMLYVSPAYERLWGRTCQSLYEQPMTWLDALHAEDRPRFMALAQAQANGEYDVEYRIVRPDGTERWIHDRAFPILDATGQVVRVAGVAEDITARRRLEAELLKITDHEQQRLGQDLHDDLCQQLAGLAFQLEALLPALDAAPAPRRSITEICAQLRHATTHARNLAHGLSPVPVEPDGLMNALRRLAESSTLLHHNVCTFSCTTPVVVADHAMAGHVYRIAQEAIANATKHGKAKHLRLTLAATTPDTARLTISDDGTGCPLPIPQNGGMGVQIMRYRAGMIGGTLRLFPNPKGGLRVTCDFFTQTS